MKVTKHHTFHIPVMGLGYTIDTPLKVAQYGISSVISIIEDELVEQIREYHSTLNGRMYIPIKSNEEDYRAKRITAYLNLVNELVNEQIAKIRILPFIKGNDLCKYFELLPDISPIKLLYNEMLRMQDSSEKELIQIELRNFIVPGSIDVNIMSKLDKQNYSASDEPLPVEYSDAMAALRGFAKSELVSSIVFSAGYNPRLYDYAQHFNDFFPDAHGNFIKKIILKVSDFRSAQIQGKFFAKKGLFISEFRIESGLNCGGHAFPTEGYLLGPILEEFKEKRDDLNAELLDICNQVWKEKEITKTPISIPLLISAQGGIGTANENNLFLKHFEIDSTGWGSPFLLVPEATNVDEETLKQLTKATKNDYYLSHASPIGIPFNNFRPSSSERQRLNRITKGRPGSPCYKKFLSSNTEFTEKPICTASREYQHKKIKQLAEKQLSPPEYKFEFDKIVEKDCLCEGLGTSALLKNKLKLSHKLTAVTICPGPNLAYFSKISTLSEMVGHIYGRINILNPVSRPNIFINELLLYIEYFENQIKSSVQASSAQIKYLKKFKENLLAGIEYYTNQLPIVLYDTEKNVIQMWNDLKKIRFTLEKLTVPDTLTTS